MSLLGKVVRGVLNIGTEEKSTLYAENMQLLSDIETLKEQLSIEKRKSGQYFELIERIERQRDERWGMFLEHSVEHQRAQATLEDSIMMLRTLLGNAIMEINGYRKKENKELVVKPIDLLAEPIGTADEFARKMRVLRESVSDPIDGKKERDLIASGQGH